MHAPSSLHWSPLCWRSPIGRGATTRLVTTLLLSVAISLACLTVQSTSAAQDTESQGGDPARQALTQKYEVAQEHYLEKRYTEALPLFEEVAVGLDSPNARLYVARCLRELDRPVEAHAAMLATQRAAESRQREEPRFAATAEAAAEELAELESRIGRVSVRVDNPPEGLVVEVAGVARTVDQLGAPLVVRPGTVHVDAIAPGRALERQSIEVLPGALEAVVLRYAEMSPPATGPITPTPTATPIPAPTPVIIEQPPRGWTSNGTIRVVGIVMAGLGGLGWGTFAVAGLMADSRFESLEQRCNYERCTDPAENDAIQTGRILDYVANGGLGLGILGTVTGGLMIIFGGADDPESPIVVSAAPGAGFVGYRLRF